MKTVIDEIKKYKLLVIARLEIRKLGNGSVKSKNYTVSIVDRKIVDTNMMELSLQLAVLVHVKGFIPEDQRLYYVTRKAI